MSGKTMCACVLSLLLAGTGWPCGAQTTGRKDVTKTDVSDTDATLKHDLVLNFDECKVPQGKTFTAEVRLRVTTAGLPAMVVLAKTSGFSCLDTVAVAAVNAAQFAPARQDGRPVMQEVVMPVDFTRVDMAQNDGIVVAPGTRAAVILSKPRLEVGDCKVKSGTHAGVVVGLTVDSQGKPTNIHILETTGNPCLDGVALKNAAAYRFDPAQRNGRSVNFEMKIEMVFEQ